MDITHRHPDIAPRYCATRCPNVVGTTLSHYCIAAELGRGGMGVVYRAHDLRLDRAVALKVMNSYGPGDEHERARLWREARAAAQLNHPHIASIYEIGEDGDRLFLVMELVDGVSLETRLGDGPLSVEDALSYGAQVASALGVAHERGIVHRDVKPANVMITPEGQIKVLDFGLAKVAGGENLTRTRATVGTAAYMSPEQIRGEEVDHRTDYWSLGVMLFEMLTGRRPFEGAYETALLYAILNTDAPSLFATRPDVPEALSELVDRLMHKEPAARVGDGGGLADDLRSMQRDPHTASVPRSTGALQRRFPARLVAAGVTITVVLLTVAYGLLRTPEAQSHALVVLPLGNYSGNPEQQYIADGMTEELIGQMGRVEAMRVISSTTAMRYRETEKTMPEIADELGVNSVVEGSVQTAGDQITIRVRLIDATSDRAVWNESFTGDLSDVLGVQRDVALAITTQIVSRLSPETEAHFNQPVATVDPEAFRLYLKGIQANQGRFVRDKFLALDFYKQAVSRDNSFAQAHAAITAVTLSLAFFVPLTDSDIDLAWRSAERAVELDPNLPAAQTTLAGMYEHFAWDRDRAEASYRRALELSPGSTVAARSLSLLLIRMRRFSEATRLMKNAVYQDPMDAYLYVTLADAYLYAGSLDLAIETASTAISIDAGVADAWLTLAFAHLLDGRTSEAGKTFESCCSDIPLAPVYYSYMAAVGGDSVAALTGATKAKSMAETLPEAQFWIAAVHARLGNYDEAMVWLTRAVRDRIVLCSYINVMPDFEPLRTDPRFIDLLRAAGFHES